MLRPLRRKLRLIRYYSASREETIWTRASDWTLITSFLLALPVAMICNVSIVRTNVATAQPGVLSRDLTNGGVSAALEVEGEPPPAWTPAVLGRFTLRIIEEQRGWPLVTSILHRPAEIEYDLYHEVERRIDAGRAADAPMREAIAEAINRRDRDDLLASWQRASPTIESVSPLRWVFTSVMWWVKLYVVGMLGLLTARTGYALYQRAAGKRARAMRDRGLCEHCGYDLRGTEFSERCPECGEYSV